MEDHKMFGRRQSYQNKRRCAYCNKPVSNGYLVNDDELKGFFCCAPHARAAYENRIETAQKEGMKLEEQA
jgi:hypothetical protein